jgi:hypothetical protein
MKGIAEHDMCVNLVELKWRHGFNRAVSANRHKGGRLNVAMLKMHRAAAGRTICVM